MDGATAKEMANSEICEIKQLPGNHKGNTSGSLEEKDTQWEIQTKNLEHLSKLKLINKAPVTKCKKT